MLRIRRLAFDRCLLHDAAAGHFAQRVCILARPSGGDGIAGTSVARTLENACSCVANCRERSMSSHGCNSPGRALRRGTNGGRTGGECGSGAWTRTRITRFKVWCAADCTTPEYWSRLRRRILHMIEEDRPLFARGNANPRGMINTPPMLVITK